MIDLTGDDVFTARNLAKSVQNFGHLICPMFSYMLNLLCFVLVFGIGYHATVIIFALEDQLGLWMYVLLIVDLWSIFNIIFNYVMANLTKPGAPESIPYYFLNKVQFTCQKCNSIKPPRTHHCSLCNQCVLQMDHHCPWIGTCVGHHNRRYFMNFVTYTTLGLAEMFLLSRYRTLDLNVLVLVMSLLVVLLGFTFYHWYIILKGKTSLEICFTDSRYQPSSSYSTNLRIVFGTSNIFYCLMPSVTPLDNWGDQWQIV